MPRAKKAIEQPTSAPNREMDPGAFTEMQPTVITAENAHEPLVAVDKPLEKEQADNLAFAEEEVTIMIAPGNEEKPQTHIDCWVNGKGAEIRLPDGRWLQAIGIPVDVPVPTRRKYAEVLIRSKTKKVTGVSVTPNPEPGRDGWQAQERYVRAHNVTIVRDANPKGAEWLRRLYAEA